MRGGASPHKNNLIGTAAVGGSKSSWLKLNTTAFSSSLLLLAHSLTNRNLRIHLIALPSGYSRLSKRIQHFVKVVTTRGKQLNKGTTQRTKSASNSKRASHVTSRSSNVSHWRFPGNTKETQKIFGQPNIKQVDQTKSLFLLN